MITRWIGPLALLAALVIGDQIRINRPDHKYRLSVEVETPDGLKSAAGILSVHPDRGYQQGGSTRTKGDAVAVDLGSGKTLVALLAHADKIIEPDGINYVAVRAFNAAGQRAVFRQMDRLKGSAPVTGELIPVLAIVSDAADPATMREVKPDAIDAALGYGFRLRGLSVAIVPTGFWPIDFGGVLGEPVTRSIVAKFPWLKQPDGATRAIEAAGLTLKDGFAPKRAFTRD